jgi:hypothetical protein
MSLRGDNTKKTMVPISESAKDFAERNKLNYIPMTEELSSLILYEKKDKTPRRLGELGTFVSVSQ